MHREGFEVSRDPREAMRFYQLSWGQGYNRAAANIADVHYKGEGVPKSSSEGFKWLRLAAESGYQPSQLRLGSVYREGDGTPKNDDEAIRLLTPFATQGDAWAMAQLADGYRRTFDRKDFSRSFEWASKSAEKGHRDGQEILGQLYLAGQGVERNLSKAVTNFRLSAAQNFWQAQNLLGVMLANGEGVSRDLGEALRLLELASREGDEQVQQNLRHVRAEQERANQRARQSAWDMQQQQQREEAARRETEVRISIDRIVAPYRGRQKSLLEQIFNYSSFLCLSIFSS
jgi:TPR repeat protein